MGRLARHLAVWLLLAACLLMLGAKAEKSNETSQTKAKKASTSQKKDKQEPSQVAKDTNDSTSSDRASADSTEEVVIPPLPEDAEGEPLAEGVTATGTLTANAAAKPVPNASGAGSVEVRGSSPLRPGRFKNEPSVRQSVEFGDAVLVSSSDVPSFRKPGIKSPAQASEPAGAAKAAQNSKQTGVTALPPKRMGTPEKPAGGKAKSGADNSSQRVQVAKSEPARASRQSEPKPSSVEAGAQQQLKSGEEAETLEEYFDEGDASGNDSLLLTGQDAHSGTELPGNAAPGAGTTLDGEPLIIGKALPSQGAHAPSPTLEDALATGGLVGSSVPKSNPLQGLLALAAALALFIAIAAAYSKIKGTRASRGNLDRHMVVLEEIGLGPGRQIVILEMLGEGLVLGLTPNSINLLDKVPLASLQADYRGSVDAIVARESSQPQRWSERPQFRAELGDALNLPRLSGLAKGSQPLRLGDLRSERQVAVHQVLPLDERRSKAELIDRIREQLSKLEA